MPFTPDRSKNLISIDLTRLHLLAVAAIAFGAPKVYELKKDEIDALVAKGLDQVKALTSQGQSMMKKIPSAANSPAKKAN